MNSEDHAPEASLMGFGSRSSACVFSISMSCWCVFNWVFLVCRGLGGFCCSIGLSGFGWFLLFNRFVGVWVVSVLLAFHVCILADFDATLFGGA